MKQNLFFLLAFLSLTITSGAQITKGSVFLGGNLRIYTTKADYGGSSGPRETGFVVSPVYGKATRENLVWGVEAGVGINGADNDLKLL